MEPEEEGLKRPQVNRRAGSSGSRQKELVGDRARGCRAQEGLSHRKMWGVPGPASFKRINFNF